MEDSQFEPAAPFSDAEIDKIELVLGRKLPKEYQAFAKEYGGAFVGGLVDRSEELPILTFFGSENVMSKLSTHPDLRDNGILPIVDCELGNRHYTKFIVSLK